MQKIFSEWFWSKASAAAAAARLEKRHGYKTSVKYAMRANGSHDWLLEVFT